MVAPVPIRVTIPTELTADELVATWDDTLGNPEYCRVHFGDDVWMKPAFALVAEAADRQSAEPRALYFFGLFIASDIGDVSDAQLDRMVRALPYLMHQGEFKWELGQSPRGRRGVRVFYERH